MSRYTTKGYKYEADTPMARLQELEDKIEDGVLIERTKGNWRSELQKRCDWRGKKQQYYCPNACSVCHDAVIDRTPFCPNCGADMRKESDSRE